MYSSTGTILRGIGSHHSREENLKMHVPAITTRVEAHSLAFGRGAYVKLDLRSAMRMMSDGNSARECKGCILPVKCSSSTFIL